MTEIVRKKCSEYAYKYLMNIRGSKGGEIKFSELKMSEYLLPNEQFTIEEQRTLFGMRNGMINIPAIYNQRKRIKQNVFAKNRKI